MMMHRVKNGVRVSRVYFSLVLALEGLVTLVAPDRLILVAAYQSFFEGMPRPVWGVVQIISALLLAGPAWDLLDKYRAATVYPAIICSVMWSLAALYPYFLGRTGNLVTATLWFAWGLATWWLCYPGSHERFLRMTDYIQKKLKVRNP